MVVNLILRHHVGCIQGHHVHTALQYNNHDENVRIIFNTIDSKPEQNLNIMNI